MNELVVTILFGLSIPAIWYAYADGLLNGWTETPETE